MAKNYKEETHKGNTVLWILNELMEYRKANNNCEITLEYLNSLLDEPDISNSRREVLQGIKELKIRSDMQKEGKKDQGRIIMTTCLDREVGE